MNSKFFDGRVEGNALVFESATKGIKVTKAILLSIPNFENAPVGLKKQVQYELQTMLLRDVGEDISLQVNYRSYADAESHLSNYFENTRSLGANEWSKDQRDFQYVRHSEALNAGMLRTTVAELFYTKHMNSALKNSDHFGQIEAAKDALDLSLAETIRGFQRVGGVASMIEQQGLCEALQSHFNPELCDAEHIGKAPFDLNKSIFENCLESRRSTIKGEGAYLRFGDYFHTFVALEALPQATCPGSVMPLCVLPFKDYALSVKVQSANIQQVIAREERRIAKLRRASETSRQTASLVNTIHTIETRIARLLSGDVGAYHIQFYTHIWATSKCELNSKVKKVCSAVHSMQGAKPALLELSTSSRNALFASMPGSQYHDVSYRHYAEDINLADLLPIAGNDVLLDDAYEALYSGSNQSLHGVNLFRNKAPEHAFFTGKTKSGKSSFQIELLTQTEPHRDKLYIIDVGMSYATYVQTYPGEVKSFVIEANGAETLNYFSTQGRAYTSSHQIFVSKVVALLAGQFVIEQNYREGLIIEYVHEFSMDWAQQWMDRDADREHVGWKAAYAIMSEESEQPTHSDFYRWLTDKQDSEIQHSEDLRQLVLLLRKWCRHLGGYTLLDGRGTISLNADVIHIELSKLSDVDKDLQNVASFIVTGMIRDQIINLPRSLRKVLVFEELGAFLQIPGGESIVHDMMQRSRKYNAVVLSTIQQLSLLPQDLVVSILGNCSQAFLFWQVLEEEARVLQKALNLPESAVRQMLSFGEPTPEHGAWFLHVVKRNEVTQVVVARSVISPEMYYVSSTTGDEFEAREVALAGYQNKLEGIYIEAQKSLKNSG